MSHQRADRYKYNYKQNLIEEDTRTGELSKASESQNGQILKMRSKLRVFKANALAASISDAYKQLSDCIGNWDKASADSNVKVQLSQP